MMAAFTEKEARKPPDLPYRVFVGFAAVHKPHLRQAFQGITDYARHHGNWALMLGSYFGGADPQSIREMVDRADGIITGIGPFTNVAEVLEHRQNLPRVIVGGEGLRLGYPCVRIDAPAVAVAAADHLADRGLENLAVFRSGERYPVELDDLAQGFKRRVAELGLRFSSFFDGPRSKQRWTRPRQIADLADWFRQQPLPLGLFLVDTDHAWRAMEACRIAGLRVGSDVALICVGDDPMFCDATEPKLSHITANHLGLGRAAAEKLHRAMAGFEIPPDTVLPGVDVAVRASTELTAYADREIAAAIRFIYDHVEDAISVDDVAAHVHVSPRTLLRRFQHIKGHGVYEEIRRSRVETAKRLLTTTDLPMAHVAVASGMGLQSKLSQEVRRATGRTPTRYRKEHSPI